MRNVHFQSELPSNFMVPPLVQPSWKLSDLNYLLHNPIERLEQDLCEKYGVKYCLLLDSARSGIYLLSTALNLKGEWLSTSFNYRPTAVLMNKLLDKISFADISNDFTMDPISAEASISASTEAIYVTHMFGKSANMPLLREISDKNGLFLIENAVHASNGLHIKNKPIGSWGDATLLSFNLDKPLGGLSGGALLTNHKYVWQAVKSVSLAIASISLTTERVISSYLGYKLKPLLSPLKNIIKKTPNDLISCTQSFPINIYETYLPKKIHSIQASVALSRLAESNSQLETRIQHADYLNSLIDDSVSFHTPKSTKSQPHSYLYYPVVFPDINRHELSKHYSKHGIETKWRYFPLHLQEDFKKCNYVNLDKTEELWHKYLLLPIGCDMTNSDLDYIANISKAFTSTP